MEEKHEEQKILTSGKQEDKGPKELVILQKAYDMLLYAYPALEQFPKSQKFSLAADIKHCMDRIVRLIVMANKKYTKKTTLQDLDVELASLKLYVRLARDLRYLPVKKYDRWGMMLGEIGRLLGGWIKANTQRPSAASVAQDAGVEAEKAMFACTNCGAEITAKIKAYSRLHYKTALCYKCQNAMKQRS